jgi:site-specific DNA recombinase
VDFYLRLSNADDGADSLERQESDLREWARREGLTVRKVWSDYGRSGFKKDVRRDGFDAAVKAVVSGEVATRPAECEYPATPAIAERKSMTPKLR